MFLAVNILFLFLTAMPVAFTADEQLELVHVLFRHGDRSPIRTYPLDPYKNESYWPEGLGQLTKNGKRMEYKLGEWLRNRYGNFVKETFSPDEVNILSTDYDRTIMSAECVLAAFYYPDFETRFNSAIPWMPAAIHTAGADRILNVDVNCPEIAKQVSILPEAKEFFAKNADLAKYLSAHTGLDIKDVIDMHFLYDVLYVQKLHNLTLPDWAPPIMDDLKKAEDFSYVATTFTTKLRRLRGGPLMSQIVDNMQKKFEGKLDQKMFMYSGHDTTVAILLACMKVFDKLAPPYAATVLVELHSIEGEYYVKIFYRNNTNAMDDQPILLTVPDCTPVCPLSKWTEIMSYTVPENWEEECHPDVGHDYILWSVIGCLAVVLVLILIGKKFKLWGGSNTENNNALGKSTTTSSRKGTYTQIPNYSTF